MPTPPFPTIGAPPSSVRLVNVPVILDPGAPPTLVTVPANSHDEAMRFLHDVGNGSTAGVAYGSVLSPIRNAYKRQLEQVELAIWQRRTQLGPHPTEYELRGLAQWGARQRAQTARLWRLPLPITGAGLEARDWRVYGAGGRTFNNLVARNAAQGRSGVKAYERIIGSASRSNPEFNTAIARGAKFMRGGGAVLGMAGLAFTAYDIWQAPEGQRLEAAKRDAVGFAGGLIGAEVFGGLLAVGAGLLLATPPGWVVIAVGLVGGIVGSILTDRVFYPNDYRSAAAAMRDGFVLDPRHPPRGFLSSGGMGSTTLPVVKQITLTVQPGDTPVMLKRRANLQAAASVGLLPAEQAEFANRYDGLKLDWMAGDPTPLDGNVLNQRDIASMVGQRVVIQTTVSQRSELEALAGR